MIADLTALKAKMPVPAYLESKGYELAGRGTERYLPQGCPFCGTANPGHSDRFRVWADGYWCRQCGAKGDIISLVESLDRKSFTEACSMLGAAETQTTSTAGRVASPSPAWNTQTQASHADECHRLLMATGNVGQEYLMRRGLLPHTWERYHLGFTYGANPSGQPAITIPWYRKGQCMAIHYRYIAPNASKKLDSERGSTYKGNLYGGHVCRPSTDTLPYRRLIVTEGELNAVSIWQVAGDWIDVLSVGSESMQPTAQQVEYLKGYGTVLAWLDKPEKAQAMGDLLGGRWIASEKIGGDANDLLKRGTLALTLVRLMLKIGDSRQLRYDLADALSRPNADAAALEYCTTKGIWNV